MSYPISRLPIIVAHRSNSYNRIRSIIVNGITNMLEIDVIRSPRDGSIIMQHVDEEEFIRNFVVGKGEAIDEEGVFGKFFEKINDKIKESKIKKSKKYRLSNVLKYINELSTMYSRRINVIIDLKTRNTAYDLANIIRSTNFNGEIYICSRYHRELTMIKNLIPEIKVLASFDDEPIDLQDYLTRIRADGASIHSAFIDEDLVDELHKHNYILAAWTVNDYRLARHLTILGVDIIITDYPETIKKALLPGKRRWNI